MPKGVGIGTVVFVCFLASVGFADSPSVVQPKVIHETSLTFSGPPNIPGLSAAWVIGSEKGGGPYALRVKLRDGGVLPPHTHPDARITTVLRGTVSVGFGEIIEPGNTHAAGPGDTYLVPAGTPHFLLAKSGDVEYTECGDGVTGTTMVSSIK
jgi:quercetin dioxygenase-like cupin family protein